MCLFVIYLWFMFVFISQIEAPEEDGRSSGTYMKVASPMNQGDDESEYSEGRFIHMAPQDG